MNCYNISSVADMTKKPTERKVSETKKKTKKTKTNNNNNNDNNKPRELSIKDEKSIQIANIIPVLEERFSVSKKTFTEHAKIEKRWITKTKKIEVPVSSEEVYINDKLMKSYEKDDQEEDVLSEVNKQIVQSFEDIDSDSSKKRQYSILESNEFKRELIPLFDDIDNNSINNSTKNDVNTNNKEIKKIIPILGEQLVVSKRIVQIGELVITKNKVIENKKIAVDTISEKATIRYPDGNTKVL
jgi:stress response protein YsnF